MTNLPSNFLQLNKRDFIKGLILAVLVPALLAIQQALAGAIAIDWKALAITALASFLGYLIKNLFTNDVPAAIETVKDAEQKKVDLLRA